jgi:septal ring factor EnvC (AmiA/AmiB activator)
MMKTAVFALLVASAASTASLMAKSEARVESAANPIRRVVTMLQMMQKKVEAEGEKEKELFEKFMCYCKSSKETLAKSIADAEAKVPQLISEIKAAESELAQLQEDLKNHKNDREEAKAAMAKATEIREKEAAAFAKEKADDDTNLAALKKALAAIEKGMAGGFLQTSSAAVLRRLVLSQDISNNDRDRLTAFLTMGSDTRYAPASGEIVGILKQMGDTMEKDIADLIAQEEAAIKAYDELMAAKQKEVDSLTKAIEEKTKRAGEVGIEIVNLKEDLDDTAGTLAEDKKFLADLEKNCESKAKEWELRCKTRQEELLALADTIKILNDDDALELFKKTIPSASFLQVAVTMKQMKEEALRAIAGFQKTGHRDMNLDLISMAIRGKKVNFDKVIKMIDDMVVLLGKEQVEDDEKKAYCEAEFDKADDKKKALERSISDLEKSLEEAKESVTTLTEEIKALEDGIIKLDREVAEATMTRKEEHEEFTATLAANNAAVQLIEFAKNRMNKFYNPKLYKPPPKRELTEEERITLNMGGTLAPTNPPGGIAGTGVGLEQVGTVAAPPPPPETFGEYKKKGEESNGVISMMDMLKADVKKEIQEMTFNENDAQEEYEQMVNDAAEKRTADTKSIEEKTAVKAGLEADIVKMGDDKASEEAELMATKQYIADLHADCDWLISNFETRKEARTNEIDALKKAKAVLSGADYSLVQVGRRLYRA